VSRQATAWGTYAKITGVLRERITSGALAPGAPIPSEAALCEEFAVVRNTARRALATLEGEGLIETLPGKGRTVRDGTPAQCAYRRIAADLRTRIKNRQLAPGDILPSEAGIVAQYGVARGTARTALATLANEGLIETRHGKGRYVRRTPGPPTG
jgi:DNA-binding GntR family transcriptional regulator